MTSLHIFVGFAWFPIEVIQAFHTLAEVGISDPEIIGSGIGEAMAPAAAGLLVSIVLVLAQGLLRSSHRPG